MTHHRRPMIGLAAFGAALVVLVNHAAAGLAGKAGPLRLQKSV